MDATETSSMGAFEVKTHFAKVLDRVEHGETITVTRHGKAVARIVPDEEAVRDQARDAFNKLRRMRGVLKNTSIEQVVADVHDGHRF